MRGANLAVEVAMEVFAVGGFTVRKRVLACLVECSTIGELGLPERSKLLCRGGQLEFRRDGRLHRQLFFFTIEPTERKAALPPTSEARGYPRRTSS